MSLIRSITTQDNESIRSIRLSPNGQMLAAGIIDGSVRLWRAKDGGLLKALKGRLSSADSIAFSPDGSLLAAADSSEILLWRVANGKLLRSIKPADGQHTFLSNLAFSPDGQLLATVTNAATTLWRVTDGGLVRTFESQETEPWAFNVVFSPDGQMLLTDGKGIKLWSVSDGKLLRVLMREKELHPLALSADGQIVATGGYSELLLLKASNGEALCTLRSRGMVGEAEDLVFASGSKILVSSNLGETHEADDKIRAWMVNGCRQVQTIPKSGASTYSHLAVSRDGQLLAIGDSGNRGKALYGVVRLFRVNAAE